MSSTMSRRNALAAFAAAPIANVSSDASSRSEDPVFAMQREVSSRLKAWLAIDEVKDKAAYEAAGDKWTAAEWAMIATPATTIAGVVAKLEILRDSITDDGDADIEDDQDAAIITHALEDLRRIAGEHLSAAAE